MLIHGTHIITHVFNLRTEQRQKNVKLFLGVTERAIANGKRIEHINIKHTYIKLNLLNFQNLYKLVVFFFFSS